MFEYQPRAACDDPLREVVSPQALIDGLRNYTSGSAGKPRISPLGEMIGARNDRKPGVLKDSLATSTGTAILATEAIVILAHRNEEPKSSCMTHEQ